MSRTKLRSPLPLIGRLILYRYSTLAAAGLNAAVEEETFLFQNSTDALSNSEHKLGFSLGSSMISFRMRNSESNGTFAFAAIAKKSSELR